MSWDMKGVGIGVLRCKDVNVNRNGQLKGLDAAKHLYRILYPLLTILTCDDLDL